MIKVHEHLKQRRKSLGLKQEDMQLRVGMSRQQYQRLESRGNPRLNTLELVAQGLKMEVLLIPREKMREVEDVLAGKPTPGAGMGLGAIGEQASSPAPEDDPWSDMLETDDD